ncbi:MAG: hypothetical protein LBD18_04635, partial [Treponema sp.]|nr:hypothetical protein [Treponema sp.]
MGLCLLCVNACALGGNETLQKAAAKVELSALMFQIENGLINIDALQDAEYISLAIKICALIDMKEKISEGEHYLRTRFSRAPATLYEMAAIIIETDNSLFCWRLSTWQDTAFHTYGEDGAYNLKFISQDGHFEAVYNKNGVLLTADNDPLNMGTFNYGDCQTENMKHYKYDVWPYFAWNNTKKAA